MGDKLGYENTITRKTKDDFISLLLKNQRVEEAVSVARLYLVRMGETVGYESYLTWKAKEELFDLLSKHGKEEEAVSVAEEFQGKV